MSRQLALVLIGVRGSGKSSTANTLCDARNMFVEHLGTKDVDAATKITKNKVTTEKSEITVIDTPSLKRHSDLKMIYSQLLADEQNNAIFGIVINIGRVNVDEIGLIESMFSENAAILKNCIMIFTNASDLESDSKTLTLDQWINQKLARLEKLIERNQIWKIGLENKSRIEEKTAKRKEIFHKLDSINNESNKIISFSKAQFLETCGRVFDTLHDSQH